MFPELRRLERKYAKELVVIGIHSAKFTNEKDPDNIREAILRHRIEHPVVNDADFRIFRAYGARGWPHFLLIDPAGAPVGRAGGEGNAGLFDEAIGHLVEKFGDRIDRKERKWPLERDKRKGGLLSYPCKLIATGDRLFIADTNHHRILVTDHGGRILEVIGGPEEGGRDGDFKTTRFRQPTGLALSSTHLYVADTENHRIRDVDLASRTVRTLAGTGAQVYSPRQSGEALQVPLNSPWDLALDGQRLFIAMAGNHQIWTLDLKSGAVGPFSGSGREQLTDGPHAQAAFNQPSGLTILGGTLYVADSEASAIREVDLEADGNVRTIVGTGLFDFGDRDGRGEDVLMQHVLSVHAHRGRLYVADAYNHKIKVCDPATREVKTFLGDGTRGKGDGKAPRFYEPSGLWAAGDTLFVADQNNHAIRACDLRTAEVRTVSVEER